MREREREREGEREREREREGGGGGMGGRESMRREGEWEKECPTHLT